MFKAAARLHYSCNCLVGGGTRYTSGHLHSMGCVLDKKHLLTARHCWEEISNQYRWPVALRHDGMFRCEIVFEDARRDIAVLRTIEQISGKDLPQIGHYPRLSSQELMLGEAVGFVSSVTLQDSNESATSHLSLNLSYVSMFLQDQINGVQQLALSTPLLQCDATGSAIFLPNGDISGVIIRHSKLQSGNPTQPDVTANLPIVTPTIFIADEINAIMRKPTGATA